MPSQAALSSQQAVPLYINLTDEMREKAQKFSDRCYILSDTISSLAGMLVLIDQVLTEGPVFNDAKLIESLHSAVRGCKLLAESAVAEENFDVNAFLRSIATGSIASGSNVLHIIPTGS